MALDNYGNFQGYEFPSGYVDAKVLAGTTAETFTVPSGAGYVRLVGTADFYYEVGATAVAPAADVTDGTGSVLVADTAGAKLKVTGAQTISVVASDGVIITAEYWK